VFKYKCELEYEDTDGEDYEDELKLRAHNNPSGVLDYRVQAEYSTCIITYTLATGLQANLSIVEREYEYGQDEGVECRVEALVLLRSSAANFSARMIIKAATVSLEGDTLVVEVRRSEQHGKVLFIAQPQLGTAWFADVDGERKKCFEEGLREGKLGAEISIVTGSVDTARLEVTADVVQYDEVQLRPVLVDPAEGKLQLEVSSELPTGKIIVININLETLGIRSAEELKVLLNDEVVPSAASLSEVFSAGEAAAYYTTLSLSGKVLHVFVAVPHFSTHTLTLLRITPPEAAVAVFGVFAVVAVLLGILTVAAAGGHAYRVRRFKF
jgi:hypothetical protein